MATPARPMLNGVFRFVLVSLAVSLVLVSLSLATAHLLAWLWDSPLYAPRPFLVGTICSLIAFLFVVVFHLRRETQHMPFSQREQFILKAKTVLQDMGYALTSQKVSSLSFRPHFDAYLFGSGIHVTLHDHEAILTGPKVSLEFFRRNFRLLNHVQRVHLFLQDQRKFTDNVVKRVEIRLRLRADQLESVRKNVIEFLERDAEVTCELNLLVQSDNGIRENDLEFQVREWLEENAIDAELHKDLVQFVEVVHPELETEAASH